MKKYLALILVSLVASTAIAQCEEEPAQKAGTYKKSKVTIVQEITAFGKNNLGAIQKQLDAFAVVVQQAYPKPKGFTVSWTPMPYEYYNLAPEQPSYHSNWYVNSFYCNAKTHKIGLEETSLAPLMAINGINNRILLKIAGIGEKKALVNGKQLYSLPPIAKEKIKNGTLYKSVFLCNNWGNSKAVNECGNYLALITIPGKSIFQSVTREQYIDFLITSAQDEFDSQPFSKYDRVNKSAFPTPESWEKQIKKLQAQRDELLKKLKTIKDNMSNEERKLPACLKDYGNNGSVAFNYNIFFFHYDNKRDPFTDPEHGYQAVTINEDYFDKKKPLTQPQLISFTWSYKTDDKIQYPFSEAMLKNLDYGAVFGMLGGK